MTSIEPPLAAIFFNELFLQGRGGAWFPQAPWIRYCVESLFLKNGKFLESNILCC